MPTPSLSRKAREFIEKMQHKHAKQVLLKILELCQNPNPPDSLKIHGQDDFRRADVGEYRIIYRIAGEILEIYLIGKRNDDEIYRLLFRR